MNPLPPLTDDELGLLRRSIEQDGVKYPVLLDRSGNIIDGFHRVQILDELGIHDYPCEVLDVDATTADRLRWTLNLARRQLSPLDRAEFIAQLASRHEAQARAEAKQRMSRGGQASAPGKGRAPEVHPFRGTRTDEVIAERINEDLAALGEDMRVTRSTLEKSRRRARLPEETKQRIRSGETTVTAEVTKNQPRTKQKAAAMNPPTSRTRPGREETDLGAAARIRARDAELQYQSMLNAPQAKLNLPLLRRAERISEMLTELIALDPVIAAGQLPPDRCRDFTNAHAAWWAAFAAACEERRRTETPDLPSRPFRPAHAVLNPVVLGTSELPKEERHLHPGERAVLDWLRAQTEPATPAAIAVALRTRSMDSVKLKLRKLTVSGLVEVAGKAGRDPAYRATRQEGPAG